MRGTHPRFFSHISRRTLRTHALVHHQTPRVGSRKPPLHARATNLHRHVAPHHTPNTACSPTQLFDYSTFPGYALLPSSAHTHRTRALPHATPVLPRVPTPHRARSRIPGRVVQDRGCLLVSMPRRLRSFQTHCTPVARVCSGSSPRPTQHQLRYVPLPFAPSPPLYTVRFT